MAGIFSRIKPGDDRVSAHLVKAAVMLGSDGVFTDQQILDGLNGRIVTPLDAAAASDLVAVRTSITNAANAGAKLIILERFDALNIAVETGALTNETTYRNKLGI